MRGCAALFIMTRKGICLDLENSPYTYITDGYTWHFSSRLHRDKFARLLESNRKEVHERLTARYKFDITLNELADFYLYIITENRGFYVVGNGVVLDCLSKVKLNGQNKTLIEFQN